MSPARGRRPGGVAPVIITGANQRGRVGKDWAGRGGGGSLLWLHVQAGRLTEAMTCMGSGDICSGGNCRVWRYQALFGQAVIILPRSQDLECQIAWLGQARGYDFPVCGNVFKFTLAARYVWYRQNVHLYPLCCEGHVKSRIILSKN